MGRRNDNRCQCRRTCSGARTGGNAGADESCFGGMIGDCDCCTGGGDSTTVCTAGGELAGC
jgi:hypothetical protein